MKRIVALLTVIAIAFCMVPASAFSGGENNEVRALRTVEMVSNLSGIRETLHGQNDMRRASASQVDVCFKNNDFRKANIKLLDDNTDFSVRIDGDFESHRIVEDAVVLTGWRK